MYQQTKLDCLKDKGFLTQRQKLFSGKHHEFEEISPLTVKDLQVAHGAKSKTNPQSSLAAAPTSKTQAISAAKQAGIALGRKRMCAEVPASQSVGVENDPKRQKLNPAVRAVPKYLTATKINGISPSKVLAKTVVLTAEQERVLEAVKRGRSLFFTGSAGTGKSFLLKKIIGEYALVNTEEHYMSLVFIQERCC